MDRSWPSKQHMRKTVEGPAGAFLSLSTRAIARCFFVLWGPRIGFGTASTGLNLGLAIIASKFSVVGDAHLPSHHYWTCPKELGRCTSLTDKARTCPNAST